MDTFEHKHHSTLMTVPKNAAGSPEPRWPALAAILAVAGLNLALPHSLLIGPRWIPVAVVGVLLVPTVVTYRWSNHHLNWIFGHLVAAVTSFFLMTSLGRLLFALPHNAIRPERLLGSAAALWVSNILIFAVWYWRLDAGGPHARDLRVGHSNGAFLFPQMMLDKDLRKEMNNEQWSPGFVDYLFVAFNASSAFSPTDTAVLSRWAKIMMMTQSLISLMVMALLAARAVNIL